jgi:hypothetical protein
MMSQMFVRHANDAEIFQKAKFFCSAKTLQKNNHGLSKNVYYSSYFVVFFMLVLNAW